MRVCFFGASVTEQDRDHRTGEITGYVTYFAEAFAKQLGIQVSRVSAGSSDIGAAGVAYVEKVMDTRPDICILDWVTPARDTCDPRDVQHVYLRLMSSGILPVTVFFPRRDRRPDGTQIGQVTRDFCARYSLPLWDFSDLMTSVEQDNLLRDVVHTTSVGARRYAELLEERLEGEELTLRGDFGDEDLPYWVSKMPPDRDDVKTTRFITVLNQTVAQSSGECIFLLEQRVGPYSPVVEHFARDAHGSITELEPILIWDPWCYRERFCIKPISGWMSTDFRRLDIKISDRKPPYDQALGPCDPAAYIPHIKPRGDAYVIATREMDLRLVMR